jgi:protein TonB
MGYQALLFCPDEKTARTVTQVLTELEFSVEACLEPFAAVKKLMGQHFDAVVVDCDNEQNATLLFKSARGSTSNQASLAVAVVEGQAGVAKAFRLGANLVLTKPINIEQSKGTLRVARGLLRKGEPKPAAAGSVPAPAASGATATSPAAAPAPSVAAAPAKPVAAKPVAPARPTVPAKPAAVSAPRPAAIPTAKPAAIAARPAPAVAATKSIPAALAPAAQNDNEVVLPEISAENSIPAPAASASVAPAISQIAPLAPPPAKLPVPAVASVKPAFSAGLPPPIGSGAASAPAPAREAPDSHVAEISPESAAPVAEVVSDKPAEESQNGSGFVGAVPTFTFGGANLPDEQSGKGKKTFLGIAAVVLVGAALYYGWTQYNAATSAPVRTAPAKPIAAPAPKPGSVPATSGTAPTGSTVLPGSPPDSGQAIGANDGGSAAQKATAVTAPVSSAPASAKPAGSALPDVSKGAASAKPVAEPLIVKGGSAPALQSAADASDSLAPSMTGIATVGAGAPPPNLVSGADAGLKPVLQTVNISQGVSRGLLIRKVAPVYPKNSLLMRAEGTVELMTTISKSGDITHVKVLSGDAQLAKAAADAVKQWRYKPYLLNGEPVEIQTQVTINFKLPQ